MKLDLTIFFLLIYHVIQKNMEPTTNLNISTEVILSKTNMGFIDRINDFEMVKLDFTVF